MAEDANLYTYGAGAVSGLFDTKHVGKAPQALKSARRWAAVAFVWGILWVWGFGSFAAVFSSAFSWFEYRRAGKRPIPAMIAMAIGLFGLAATFALVLGIVG